jgi:hypothetical protein
VIGHPKGQLASLKQTGSRKALSRPFVVTALSRSDRYGHARALRVWGWLILDRADVGSLGSSSAGRADAFKG